MKTNIILAGVGGQGILSIAAVLGAAALKNKYYLKQAETHGMSQRGGAVVSHLRISDQPIHSDLIPLGKADIILSVEPMESLRYLPFLKPSGYLVTNSVPFANIPDYPEMDGLLGEISRVKKHILINSDEMAREIGNAKASNMIMLGAASCFIEIPFEKIEEGINEIFRSKGKDLVDLNIRALRNGRVQAQHKCQT
ncbi:MAG TPA: indolepyruvate oxidoreductase subunit beta [Prolixibacteraceae bacterium]|nr:indolepyruvate oxidoreductase subunit beta [Prolixibacteraceae bacterium]